MESALVTRKEIAARLGMTEDAVAAGIEAGEIPGPVTLSGTDGERFSLPAVEKWLADGCPVISKSKRSAKVLEARGVQPDLRRRGPVLKAGNETIPEDKQVKPRRTTKTTKPKGGKADASVQPE